MKIDISFSDVTNKNFQIDTLEALKDFLQKEADFWKEAADSLENTRNRRAHDFFAASNGLRHTLNVLSNQEKSLQGDLSDKDIATLIQPVRHELIQRRSQWVWSGHPFVQAYIESQRKFHYEGATAFCEIVIKNTMPGLNHVDALKGAIYGYEYLRGDGASIRSSSEEASLEHLRKNLENSYTDLFSQVDNFKDELISWRGEHQTKWDESGQIAHEHFNKLLEDYRTKHEKDQRVRTQTFDDLVKSSKSKIEALESTYADLLRLKKPAEYWKEAARRYNNSAIFAAAILFVLCACGAVAFYHFYDAFLAGQTLGIELDTVKGVIIFGTGVAMYAYLIRAVTKFTFSSFHLQRDAEEREQLTYLYLALVQEGAVNDASRDIILQSLFSRSETGLISNESGPTMPSIIELLKQGKA